MAQSTHLRKYGVETTIDFELYEVDGVDLRTDWVPAAADCEVMKDEGPSAECSNTATDEGGTYSIVLTATEMQAARLVLKIVDAATKAFLDKVIILETYGNASAMHAFDLDTASVAQSADNDTKISTLQTSVDGVPTNSEFNARTLVAANYFDFTTDTVDVGKWGGVAVSAGVGGDGLPASIALADRNAFLAESIKGSHTYQGNHFYVDPVNGGTHASGNRGGRTDPYLTIQDCHDNAVTDSNHDVIFLVAGHGSTVTTHTIAGTTTLSKRYLTVRGPGRDFIITRTGSGDTLAVTGDGISWSGFQLGTAATGSGHGIKITDADFVKVEHVWILDTQGDGVHILRGSNCVISLTSFAGTGVGGTGQGVHIVGTAGVSTNNRIVANTFSETAGDSILIEQGTTNDTLILNNLIHDSAGWGINIGASSTDAIVHGNIFGNNATGNITDAGTTTVEHHNRDWLSATTEGRTLDVTATGAAGIDWANVENKGSTVDLSATDIQLCDTVTTNTDVRGTDSAATAAALATAQSDLDIITGASGVNLLTATQASIDAIETDTDTTIPALIATAQADLDTITGASGVNLLTATQASIDAIETDTGTTIPALLPAALVSGRMDCSIDGTGMETGAIDAMFQRQMTESYNVDGTAPTMEQALMMIMQALTEFSISGTVITMKGLNGTTTKATFTLDDGTNPTSRTRAS